MKTNKISPDFIGDKPDEMEEGTICPLENKIKINNQIKEIEKIKKIKQIITEIREDKEAMKELTKWLKNENK